jgi:hypothetical protein
MKIGKGSGSLNKGHLDKGLLDFMAAELYQDPENKKNR